MTITVNSSSTSVQLSSEQNSDDQIDTLKGSTGHRSVKQQVTHFDSLSVSKKKHLAHHTVRSKKNPAAALSPPKNLSGRAIKQHHSKNSVQKLPISPSKASLQVKPVVPPRSSSIPESSQVKPVVTPRSSSSLASSQVKPAVTPRSLSTPASSASSQWQSENPAYEAIHWQRGEALSQTYETLNVAEKETTTSNAQAIYVLPNYTFTQNIGTMQKKDSRNLVEYQRLAHLQKDDSKTPSEYNRLDHHKTEGSQTPSEYNKLVHHKSTDSQAYKQLGHHRATYDPGNFTRSFDPAIRKQTSLPSKPFAQPGLAEKHSQHHVTPYAVSDIVSKHQSVSVTDTTSTDEENIYATIAGEEEYNADASLQSFSSQGTPQNFDEVMDHYMQGHHNLTHSTFSQLTGNLFRLSATRKFKAIATKELRELTGITEHKKSHQLNALLAKHQQSKLNAKEYKIVRELTLWTNKKLAPFLADYNTDLNSNGVPLQGLPELPSLNFISAPTEQRVAAEQYLQELNNFSTMRLPDYNRSLSRVQASRSGHSKKAEVALKELNKIHASDQMVTLIALFDDIANHNGSVSPQKIKEAQQNIAWVNHQLDPALKQIYGNKASTIASVQLRLPDAFRVS